MTFGLPSWLKTRYGELGEAVPIWYASHDQPDHREWLLTNGLGGYSSGTISGAHTRRYHGLMVSALNPPLDRHIVLSRVSELVSVGGAHFELSTDHWASGVVAPTGYKLVESFTTLPTPTWVYNLSGNYLIRQLALAWGTNQLHLGYYWLPYQQSGEDQATISIRFLTGFRNFHGTVRGSWEKSYVQELSDNQSAVSLNGSPSRLYLNWNSGSYDSSGEWWWGYHWPEESARGEPDQEDLFLIGSLTTPLSPHQEVCVSASLDQPVEAPSIQSVIESNLKRQNLLLDTAGLPRSLESNLLVLACDQFLVTRKIDAEPGLSVIAGYPWFNDCGREAMIALPGLCLATHRFPRAREIITTLCRQMSAGVLPNRFHDQMPDRVTQEPGEPEFQAVDATLWWVWSLYHYFLATGDREFIATLFPLLKQAAWHYVEGAGQGIKVDPQDGLLRCGDTNLELTWMDARVAGIPITPRSGKPVEVCALWFNFLKTLQFFAAELGEEMGPLNSLTTLTEKSMQKFWNGDKQCLYDVLEPGNKPSARPDDCLRPNQIFAVSLPFRAFSTVQERSIVNLIEAELLTPVGLRSLSPMDPSYQGRYGCGLTHADQYHRDLSYHQGTVWPWLIGPYCEALLNVFGPLPETRSKIRILLQPLLNHLTDEGCLGSISEIFDGNSPHQARGCIAHSLAVAETMRLLAAVLRG